jgi:pre-mRNA-splicing factor SPF27
MASETAQGPVIHDSLPYYDNELEQYPFLKEMVEQELAREPPPPPGLHPRVPPPITLFEVRASRRMDVRVAAL